MTDATNSLIVDADVLPSAAITDTKLAPGKVSNSATTATAANTASAIVTRDASGAPNSFRFLIEKWQKEAPGEISIALSRKEVVFFVFPDQVSAETFVHHAEKMTACGLTTQISIKGVPANQFSIKHDCKLGELHMAIGWQTATNRGVFPWQEIGRFGVRLSEKNK